MPDEIEGLLDELHTAHVLEYKPQVELIRITQYALEGSIAIMAMTRERREVYGFPEGAKEALIHPEDWYRILKRVPAIDTTRSYHSYPSRIDHLYGIRVVND